VCEANLAGRPDIGQVVAFPMGEAPPGIAGGSRCDGHELALTWRERADLAVGPADGSPDSRAGAPYLVSGAVTVTGPESQRKPLDPSVSQWWQSLEWSWRRATRPERARWEGKRREARRRRRTENGGGGLPDLTARHEAYARRRRDALDTPRKARVDACGEQTIIVACGCGQVAQAVGCRQRWLCKECRRKWCRRLRGKLHRACKMWSRGRGRDRWHLVTLTVEHSGNIAADRERIVRGWARLRAWYRKREQRSFPYALVWEATPGADGCGHVHAHAIVLWPRFDWSLLAAEWSRATGAKYSRIGVEVAKRGPGGAAEYVTKYASKGVELGDFPPVLAGTVLGAFYCKRTVSSSRRFWRPMPPPVCKRCNSAIRLVEPPPPMRLVNPGLVWSVRARVAWWSLHPELFPDGVCGEANASSNRSGTHPRRNAPASEGRGCRRERDERRHASSHEW
jgi:hypothetical protein